jgi:hypothetical protein
VSGQCEVHGSHRPEPITLHHHHIQPLGMGGPDVAANRVLICPTGHYNVHAVMAALVFNKPLPRASRTERQLALAGYRSWVAAGKPGNPHAAYGLHPHVMAGEPLD